MSHTNCPAKDGQTDPLCRSQHDLCCFECPLSQAEGAERCENRCLRIDKKDRCA